MGFFSKDSRIKKLVKGGRLDELVKRHLEGEVVVPEIISLLEDEEGPVRVGAAIALGSIAKKDPEAVKGAIPRLISLLEDKEWPVRVNAALALGRMGTEEALEKLRGLLSDAAKVSIVGEETTVGEIAREAIERIEKR